MVLGAVVSALVLGLVAAALSRRLGWVGAVSWSGLVWSLVVIALFTLMPDRWDPGIIAADSRATTCSLDYGGPAPDGFWIFGGTQRMLNTLLFVPAGAFWVLAVSRWRIGWLLAPAGVVFLVCLSVAIELVQLGVARIDRACDITDMADNATGAVVGALLGLVLLPLLRPWRR